MRVKLYEFLFSKVIYMSMSAIVVSLFVLLFQRITRKMVNKQWKYYSWMLVILALMVPITIPKSVNQQIVHKTVNQTQMGENEGITSSNDGAKSETSAMEPTTDNLADTLYETDNQQSFIQALISKGAAVIWIFGMLVLFLFRIIVRVQYIHKLHKQNESQVIDPEWETHLREILFREAANINMRRVPRIKESFAVSSPMIFGVFHTTIYLPALPTNQEELAVVLRHELIHYKRYDLIYKELMAIAKIIHWFNPFVWIFERQLDDACEMSCDELVIDKMNLEQRKFYGKTLLTTIFKERNMNHFAMATLNKKGGSTERRIQEIMMFSKKQRKLITGFCMILITICTTLGSTATADVINGCNNSFYQKNAKTATAVAQKKKTKSKDYDEDDFYYSYDDFDDFDNDFDDDFYDDLDDDYDDDMSGFNSSCNNYRYKGHDITYYVNHADKVKQKTLDKVMISYIKETKDIGAVFCVIDRISTSAVDKIANTYIKDKKDYGMYYSLKEYMSKSAKKKLGAYVKKHMQSDNENSYEGKIDDSYNTNKLLMNHTLKYSDMTGRKSVIAEQCTGNVSLFYGKIKNVQTVSVKYNLKIKSGSVKVMYKKPNNITETLIKSEGKDTIDLSMLNGITNLYLDTKDATFTLELDVTKK